MYHLPLLPGYDPSVNVRSSVAAKSPGGKSFLRRLSEAEENGYEGTYFASEDGEDSFSTDGYIVSSSPLENRIPNEQSDQQRARRRTRAKSVSEEKIAEVIFFSYGVIVFFGLLSTTAPAYLSILGPKTGMRQMIQARFSFG